MERTWKPLHCLGFAVAGDTGFEVTSPSVALLVLKVAWGREYRHSYRR